MNATEIREAATANWYSDRNVVGHIHYNTQHEIYLARLSETRWEVIPAHLIEMNPAQLDAFLFRLCDARQLARKLLLKERVET